MNTNACLGCIARVIGFGLGVLGCSGEDPGAAAASAGGMGGAGGTAASMTCDGGSAPLDPTALIDDMEDNDSQLVAAGQRNGLWWLTTDMSGGTIAPPGDQPPSAARILGARCASKYAMRFQGQGFTATGVTLGAYLRYTTDLAAIDASSFRGVTFWARVGEANASPVRVQFEDANSFPQGGVCNPARNTVDTCYDSFGTTLVPIGTEWRQYKVDFSRTAQRGFGLQSGALDLTTLYAIEFGVEPNTVFDVWVDDLWFYE